MISLTVIVRCHAYDLIAFHLGNEGTTNTAIGTGCLHTVVGLAIINNAFFHQRGSHDSAADVSAVMSGRLEQGRKVTIFPEGGIKPGSSVRTFHARLFRSAVDVGCPIQPVMVRYMRNGKRDDDISFRKNESMLVNFSRLLGRPSVIADVHFLSPISSVDKPRRELADAARMAVVAAYESCTIIVAQ